MASYLLAIALRVFQSFLGFAIALGTIIKVEIPRSMWQRRRFSRSGKHSGDIVLPLLSTQP